MQLFLVRHGQSANNAGHPRVADPPLTAMGQRQARRAAAWLRHAGITALYCSPFLRTLQTAAPIVRRLQLVPRIAVELHEWGGCFQLPDGGGPGVQVPGLGASAMRAVVGTADIPDQVSEAGWWFGSFAGDAAMFELAAANASRFLAHMRDHHDDDDRICVVSHGGSGSSLIGMALGLGGGREPWFEQHNTAVTALRWKGRSVELSFLNRLDHLPRRLHSM